MGPREFVLLMGLLTAMSSLAIDIMLPAFAQMRIAFGLDDDSTRLSLTVTLFLMGVGVGHLFYGPIADAVGRKPTLVGSMVLYAAPLWWRRWPHPLACSTSAGSHGGSPRPALGPCLRPSCATASRARPWPE